jgi:replication factor A1
MKQLTKRLVVLMDKSLLSVELTLWGETADKYGDDIVSQVIAVKAAKVSGYGGGRSLSSTFGSRIFVGPDVEDTKSLREWYDTTGKDAVTENITKKNIGSGGVDPRKTFQQLKVEDLGIRGDKAFYFLSRCTPIFFRHDNDKPPWYSACPTPNCNRKVSQDAAKMWRCEKCDKSFAVPSPRYILSVHAVDTTGDLWLTAFNDVAQQLLGHTAQAVSEFKDAGNEKAYEQVFKDANFKTYLFKCRAKQELREETGDTKVRFHVLAATPVNYKQECHFLLEEIGAYLS